MATTVTDEPQIKRALGFAEETIIQNALQSLTKTDDPEAMGTALSDTGHNLRAVRRNRRALEAVEGPDGTIRFVRGESGGGEEMGGWMTSLLNKFNPKTG